MWQMALILFYSCNNWMSDKLESVRYSISIDLTFFAHFVMNQFDRVNRRLEGDADARNGNLRGVCGRRR
jgi:hypothetical protein